MSWFFRFAEIITIVFQVVKIIEQVLTERPGPEKKEAAAVLVKKTMASGGSPPKGGDEAFIEQSIDDVVGTLNEYGAFTHSEAIEPVKERER